VIYTLDEPLPATQYIDFVADIQNGFVSTLQDTYPNVLSPIKVHRVLKSEACEGGVNDRRVFSLAAPTDQTPQKAMHVHETADIDNDYPLGECICSRCTPNQYDHVWVYTERIRKEIQDICKDGWTCKDMPTAKSCQGAGPCSSRYSEFFKRYLKHIVAHAMGHNLLLTPTLNKGVPHYPERDKVVMSDRVMVRIRSKQKTAEWHITGEWHTDSQEKFLLK
jgi:hypothetical protein